MLYAIANYERHLNQMIKPFGSVSVKDVRNSARNLDTTRGDLKTATARLGAASSMLQRQDSEISKIWNAVRKEKNKIDAEWEHLVQQERFRIEGEIAGD